MGLRRILPAVLKRTLYFPVPLLMWQHKPTRATEIARNVYLLHLLAAPLCASSLIIIISSLISICHLAFYFTNSSFNLKHVFLTTAFLCWQAGLLKQLTGSSH